VGDENAFYLITTTTSVSTRKIIYGYGVYENYLDTAVTPYFLASTLIYDTVGTSIDFSTTNNNSLPFVYSASQSGILIFNNVGKSTQGIAVPQHGLYLSGRANNYANTFVVRPFVLLASSYLVGSAPFLRYLDKARSDPFITPVSFDNTMYLLDGVVVNNGAEGRIAFNLGRIQ